MQKNENFDDLFTSQPITQSTPSDKEAWIARKQQEREMVFHQIDETVSTMVGDGELFQTYLDVQARFDRYSVSNAILITGQMPEATRLADFDSWKASGAYVKRGTVAISILEPGKEYQREGGSIGVAYNVKQVFDISQTNTPARPVPTVQRDERLLLKSLLDNPPCKIEVRGELPGNRNVAYSLETGAIQVRRGLDAQTIFRGLTQELARVHLEKGGKNCTNPDFVADSASYILCRRNGVPVDNFSFQRLPEAYKGMNPQELRRELGAIREVAGEISADMNRFFEAKQKSQKSRDTGAR